MLMGEAGKYTMYVAARLTGVQAHRLRGFEDAGLPKPARTEAGQRLYPDPEIELINEIAGLEDEGINLRLMHYYQSGSPRSIFNIDANSLETFGQPLFYN